MRFILLIALECWWFENDEEPPSVLHSLRYCNLQLCTSPDLPPGLNLKQSTFGGLFSFKKHSLLALEFWSSKNPKFFLCGQIFVFKLDSLGNYRPDFSHQCRNPKVSTFWGPLAQITNNSVPYLQSCWAKNSEEFLFLSHLDFQTHVFPKYRTWFFPSRSHSRVFFICWNIRVKITNFVLCFGILMDYKHLKNLFYRLMLIVKLVSRHHSTDFYCQGLSLMPFSSVGFFHWHFAFLPVQWSPHIFSKNSDFIYWSLINFSASNDVSMHSQGHIEERYSSVP